MHLANSEAGVTFQLIRASGKRSAVVCRTGPTEQSRDLQIASDQLIDRLDLNRQYHAKREIRWGVARSYTAERVPYTSLYHLRPSSTICIHLPQFGVYLNGCFFMSHSIWSPHCCFVISVPIMCWESDLVFSGPKKDQQENSRTKEAWRIMLWWFWWLRFRPFSRQSASQPFKPEKAMVHLVLCHSLSLWWTASASSSFYSPVQYFGTVSQHNGMSYPHQGIAITNNNGIVIGGWFGSSEYWSSTYEYTHTATSMLVSTPGASKGCKEWKWESSEHTFRVHTFIVQRRIKNHQENTWAWQLYII